MKNTILFIICLFFSFSYSQSEKEMLDAGIKKGTVKIIMKKFDGNVKSAIDKWASSGNSKLSKKFVKSATTLGYDPYYLDTSLKQARKNRLAQGIAGALAAGTAIALSQVDGGAGDAGSSVADGAGSLANSIGSSRRSSYSKNSYGSMQNDSIYSNNVYGAGSTIGVQPGAGETTMYGQDQYGFEKEVGSMKDDGYGNTTIYGKDQYGFDKEVGTMKDNGYGETTVYGKDQYGFDKETRKYQKNNKGGFDVLEKDQYGFWKKVV